MVPVVRAKIIKIMGDPNTIIYPCMERKNSQHPWVKWPLLFLKLDFLLRPKKRICLFHVTVRKK